MGWGREGGMEGVSRGGREGKFWRVSGEGG